MENISEDKPRVSIGLPVFNGEKYLKKALDSILNQKYHNFELIISDNASTDKTQDICRYYVKKDKRIRYYRNKKNIGAAKNYNFVFKLSSGEYFKWAAHDDMLAPDYLLKCIEILDSDQSIVVCHSRTGIINENGKLLGHIHTKKGFDSTKPHKRFGNIIRFDSEWPAIQGVIRSKSLIKTPLMGNYIYSDRTLIAELALIGRVHEIPEILFFRRSHPEAYTNRIKKFTTYKKHLAWWDPISPKQTIPRMYMLIEFFRSLRRVPLKWYDKFLCCIQIINWLIKGGFMMMIVDISNALLGQSIIKSILRPFASIIIGYTVYPDKR